MLTHRPRCAFDAGEHPHHRLHRRRVLHRHLVDLNGGLSDHHHLVDRLHHADTEALVFGDEDRERNIDEAPEGHACGVAARKSYAAFDVAAVCPRPDAEGEGSSVGKLVCCSTSQVIRFMIKPPGTALSLLARMAL